MKVIYWVQRFDQAHASWLPGNNQMCPAHWSNVTGHARKQRAVRELRRFRKSHPTYEWRLYKITEQVVKV